jgi:hypothetical protein
MKKFLKTNELSATMSEQRLRALADKAEQIITTIDDVPLERLTDEHLFAIKHANTLSDKERQELQEKPDLAVRAAARIIQRNAVALRKHCSAGDLYSAMDQEFGERMTAFFAHDSAHLADHLAHTMRRLGVLAHGECTLSKVGLANALATNDMTEQVRSAFCRPWQMLQYLVSERLVEPRKYDEIDVYDTLKHAGNILACRFDAVVTDHTPAQPSPGEKTIVIEGSSCRIKANKGCLFSIPYNNLKNSLKKIEQLAGYDGSVAGMKRWNETTFTAKATIKSLDDQFLAVTFTDSGAGIDLDKMLERVADGMLQGKEHTWPNQQLEDKFVHWRENDYAFNMLTLEDVTNVAFMAQLSGATIPNQLSSGMGLYGTKYLIENTGGAILYATTFSGQHPLFCYIIPRAPQDSQARAFAIRKQLINRRAA